MRDDITIRLCKSEISNTANLSYAEYRKTLTPKWTRVWGDIALGWASVASCAAVIVAASGRNVALDLLLVVAGSLGLGFAVAYLQLFFHEAAHFNIHPNRNINDLLCNIFVSGIVGQDIKEYRPIHWDHHKHLGTPMDSEISYFDPLNVRFLVESLLGVRAMKVALLRKKRLTHSSSHLRPAMWMRFRGLSFNAVGLALLVHFQQWNLMLAWVGGLVVWFPFFGALRQVLEHRDESADPAVDYTHAVHGAIHRLFGDGLLAGTLGGAGFNRHLLHHWDPQVSYTRLRELEGYLMDTAAAPYLTECKTTYFETFRRLFRFAWR